MVGDRKDNDVSVCLDDAPASALEAVTTSMILRNSEVDANIRPFTVDDNSDKNRAALLAQRKHARERIEQLLFDREQGLDEQDRKIANKDAAISELLAKLSGRHRSGESLHEFELSIGAMVEQIAASECGHTGRERIMRVLIGYFDFTCSRIDCQCDARRGMTFI